MKAKLLLMLFLVFLSLGVFASERHRKKPHAQCKAYKMAVETRSPFDPSIQAEDINDCLYLTFQFSLDDADITILDKDGNEVIKEQQTIIYEGRTISIPMADAYPYSVEIKSSSVEIQGGIILE
ncbi:DUF3244 domain-containing protein [Phocaeicola sartorii]|uniref:DUF3244 domain-containing protein n=1 Tax=Phocaeicola sartorii TaxID=671267 RepID=R9IKP8_9BACT|nr:DUF3244 domain-containing protein [Phocaeicola sartorii]EOS15153.1 hypothetical protein C802_00487 [Phocaeicola sartorii]MCR1847372.1 DUF3244 domain-containing protein [Phocaeicola sartorii]NUK97573.1 DUF3244 domain-containing protein [Phocaeicola sartorii]